MQNHPHYVLPAWCVLDTNGRPNQCLGALCLLLLPLLIRPLVANSKLHEQNTSTPLPLSSHDIDHWLQVIALVSAPFLLDHPKIGELFPQDAIDRARQLYKAFNGGVGAYQDSRGNALVREEVAKFIEERDGAGPADANVSKWLGFSEVLESPACCPAFSMSLPCPKHP